MRHLNRLRGSFVRCNTFVPAAYVGAEIETSFVDALGQAITLETSQRILADLTQSGWRPFARKGKYIASIVRDGAVLCYDLGRQNIELATRPMKPEEVCEHTQGHLAELYAAAKKYGAYPHFAPVLESGEDLLAILDERDALWLELDGKGPLELLARTSSVQFTIGVTPKTAVPILNKLFPEIPTFLADYPQEKMWREYIRMSQAGYRKDRYGGPLWFQDIEDYCRKLLRHAVVTPEGLREPDTLKSFNIPLFLRSIWWYFRLRRHGNQLCIEVRPLPRRDDAHIAQQFTEVMRIMDS